MLQSECYVQFIAVSFTSRESQHLQIWNCKKKDARENHKK